MNKYFWSEYIDRYIDQEMETHLLKSYQYAVSDLGGVQNISLVTDTVELGDLLVPDTYLESYKLSTLHSNIRNLVENINDFIGKHAPISSFPVFLIRFPKHGIKAGVYMYNSAQDEFRMVKEVDGNTYFLFLQGEFYIFWFLVVELALALFQKASMVKGIICLTEMRIATLRNFEYEKVEFPFNSNYQRITKELLVSPKYALLFDVDLVFLK